MPFIPFRVDFLDEQKNSISADQQSDKIVGKLVELSQNSNFKGAGIIYSANYEQTKNIRRAYLENQPTAEISGLNQAEVIRLVESKLKANGLEYKFHIIPITTCLKSGGSGTPSDEIILGDLANLSSHLKAEWDILGWQNQLTAPKNEFAIGGGVSLALQPTQMTLIQGSLKRFAYDYPKGAQEEKEVPDHSDTLIEIMQNLSGNDPLEYYKKSKIIQMTAENNEIDIYEEVPVKTWGFRPSWFWYPTLTTKMSLNDYINKMKSEDPKKHAEINEALEHKNLEELKTALAKHRSWFGWGYKTTGLQILEQLLPKSGIEQKPRSKK